MYSGIETDHMIGKRFGKLTVIQFIEKDDHRNEFYKCLCDCGQTSVTRKSYLVKGKTKSCGCLAKERLQDPEYHRRIAENFKIDMVGHEYGSWVVLSESGRNKRGEVTFLCRCECGTEKVILGRSIRNKSAKRHCGCKDPVKKEKPKKPLPFSKRIDSEQYAKDLYCYYLDGQSIRSISRDNGYRSSSSIIRLFHEFIPMYHDISKQRRKSSGFIKKEIKRNYWSGIFPKEKDFLSHCLGILDKKQISYLVKDSKETGHEIDIKTEKTIFELKVSTRKKDLFRAFGQLQINNIQLRHTAILLIPSDCNIDSDIKNLFVSHGMKVFTETDLIIKSNY